MAELIDVIVHAVSGGRAGGVERSVFDTAEPAEIAAILQDVCVESLGIPAAGSLFYGSSVGCVAGLTLADGREVVVKAYQPRWPRRFLEQVAAAQAALAAGAFPCPRPLAGPVPAGLGLALVDEHLPDPGPLRLSGSSLSVSATGLAQQVEMATSLDWSGDPGHPMDPAPGALYPTPHSPVFDFDATAAGGEWIDEWADRSKRERDRQQSSFVVGHCDWARRNVRLGPDRLLAVYDMDSLAWVPEAVTVGQAAMTWSTDDGTEPAPDAMEVARYVATYETARGERFDETGIATVGAAAAYVLAYSARCEHAIDPAEVRWRRARPRLRTDATALLCLPDLIDQARN